MAAKFEPNSDQVMVCIIEKEKVIDGVFIPDSSKDDMLAGIIMAVGASTSWAQEGDQVLFGPWAGKPIQIEGVPFRVMHEEEIIGRLKND